MHLLMLELYAWWFSYPGRHYKNTSLGMGLSIASKLEGGCLHAGGCGVVVAQLVRALVAKARGPGFDSGRCPDVFSSSKLSDVDGVMSSMVL